jgi:putative ABC transport system permease protein
MLAGGDLFKLFSYTLVQGTPSSALASPVSIALSEKTARLFFGDAATAMGKTIRCEDRIDLTVTGVYKDLDERDSRKFDYVINWDVDYKFYPSNKLWGNSGPLTFVMLRRDADTALVNRKLKHFIDKYNPPGPGYHNEFALQRFDQVYLHSRFENGKIAGGRIEYVRLFSIVAVFILLMACVNFMNLTTARSVKRAREIGVRKVMGAMRGALIRQFIGESLLLTVAAVIVSLLLMTLVLPLFNSVTQKQLSLPFANGSFWGFLALLTVVTGVVAGSYPALFLSSFNPVVVLKGMLKLNMGAVWFRKGLVVFQFTLSAMLIIATIVVSRQVHYIQRMDLGYDRENLIYIPIEGNLADKYAVFKTEALRLPEVASVSRTSSRPTLIDNSTTYADWDGKRSDQVVSFYTAEVDPDFLSTMKLKLVAGRDYSRAFAADTNNYIINELAREKIGYRDPIGRSFMLWGIRGKIIGLLENFHFASLHDPMQPLVIKISTNHLNGDDILVRIKPGGTGAALAGLEGLCRQLNPAFPFSYNFSDEEFRKLYKAEQVAGRLANIFAGLAILISCLGLLGLAMFTAEQRIKEIGIRKVLGAGVLSLFGLLSMDFLGLVGVAFLIASPLAWLAMNGWLQGYVYHTTMAWWIFVLAGSIVLVIALLTVSFQALKASLVNPVKSLRSE